MSSSEPALELGFDLLMVICGSVADLECVYRRGGSNFQLGKRSIAAKAVMHAFGQGVSLGWKNQQISGIRRLSAGCFDCRHAVSLLRDLADSHMQFLEVI